MSPTENQEGEKASRKVPHIDIAPKQPGVLHCATNTVVISIAVIVRKN